MSNVRVKKLTTVFTLRMNVVQVKAIQDEYRQLEIQILNIKATGTLGGLGPTMTYIGIERKRSIAR